MTPVREVAFELECFEWADEHLEVAGRWIGLAGRRLGRPVLIVQTAAGRRKRLTPVPGGQLATTDAWRAAFPWPGDPADITAAELVVGRNLVVDLPLPDRRRRRRRRQPTEGFDATLSVEVSALRAQVDRLRSELASRERELIGLRAEMDEDTGEAPAAPAGESEQLDQLVRERDEARAQTADLQRRLAAEQSATVEIDGVAAAAAGEVGAGRPDPAAAEGRLEAERAAHAAAVERLVAERDEALAARAAEVERLAAELDRLVAERDAALEAQTDEVQRLVAERDAALEAQTDEVQRLVAERDAALAAQTDEVQRLAAERDAAHAALAAERERGEAAAVAAVGEAERLTAERDRRQAALDDLREAFSEAAAEAEEVRDRHRGELAALGEQLAGARAEAERLRAALADRPPSGEAGAGAAAVAAGTGSIAAVAPEPTADTEPMGREDEEQERAARERAAAPETETMTAPTAPVPPDPPPAAALQDSEAASRTRVPAWLRGGGHPPGAEDGEPGGSRVLAWLRADTDATDPEQSPGRLRVPAWLRGDRDVPDPHGEPRAARMSARPRGDGEAAAAEEPRSNGAPMPPWRRGGRAATGAEDAGAKVASPALKHRQGLRGASANGASAPPPPPRGLDPPRRSAAPARARAGASFAARRSAAEVWATRIVALIVVLVLLGVFVLILSTLA